MLPPQHHGTALPFTRAESSGGSDADRLLGATRKTPRLNGNQGTHCWSVVVPSPRLPQAFGAPATKRRRPFSAQVWTPPTLIALTPLFVKPPLSATFTGALLSVVAVGLPELPPPASSPTPHAPRRCRPSGSASVRLARADCGWTPPPIVAARHGVAGARSRCKRRRTHRTARTAISDRFMFTLLHWAGLIIEPARCRRHYAHRPPVSALAARRPASRPSSSRPWCSAGLEAPARVHCRHAARVCQPTIAG